MVSFKLKNIQIIPIPTCLSTILQIFTEKRGGKGQIMGKLSTYPQVIHKLKNQVLFDWGRDRLFLGKRNYLTKNRL